MAADGSALLPRHGAGFQLRRLSIEDLPAFQAYRHDPELGRYQGWSPLSDTEAGAFLAEMSAVPLLQPGRWTQLGIATPDGRRLIGDIGLHLDAAGRDAEIGFTLERGSQGRGLATAAVGEALRLVFEASAAERVLGITDTRNSASIRLLERVGMRRLEARHALFRDEACVEQVYAVQRRDHVRTPMPILRPLTEAEFAAWVARSVPSYAAEKVASGAWAAQTALEQSRQEHLTLLPAGKDTPGHHFHAILGDAGVPVGTIWFAEEERGASRVAYVYDVEVWAEHQRQGHAGRAFAALEEEARRLGLAGVALHVFGHNRAAQALYAKLGYRTTNINLFKPLVADTGTPAAR